MTKNRSHNMGDQKYSYIKARLHPFELSKAIANFFKAYAFDVLKKRPFIETMKFNSMADIVIKN